MKRVFVLTISLLLVSAVGLSTQPVEEWVARYNGPANYADGAQAIAVDGSGNVYVTGGSWGSDTLYDYATIKYNPAGTEQWVARYNGPGNDWDVARSIVVDVSGNVYVTGQSRGSGTDYDYATIKYNSAGEEQWVARYSVSASYYDPLRPTIAVDGSGNVYITATNKFEDTGWDYVTIKYNSAGEEQWVARYNGPASGEDIAWSLALDGDGNVYITGYSESPGTGLDYATIKYNPVGNEEWVARYNGPGNGDDVALSIALDGSGNVYVTGGSDSSGEGEEDWDYATIKYNSSGIEQWVARYNAPANDFDVAFSLALDGSGNIYVTGLSYVGSTSYEYATIKYNSAGEEQWVARYSVSADFDDILRPTIAVDGSGNVYITATSQFEDTDYDYVTIKYNSVGIEQWVARYNGPGNEEDWAWAIALDGSGNVYVTGGSVGSGAYSDYATIKYSQGPGVTDAQVSSPIQLSTYLNRLSYDLHGETQLNLYSADGRKVLEEMVEGQGIWEAPVSLAQGVYFCRMQAGSFTATEKLILIR